MGDCDATNVAHTNERTAVSFRILCVDKMLDSFLTQEYALYGKKKAPWDTVLFQVLVWHRAAGQDCGAREKTKNHMARHYLQLGTKQVPVTDEQARELTRNRFNPERVEEIRAEIFAAVKPAKLGMKPQTVPAS